MRPISVKLYLTEEEINKLDELAAEQGVSFTGAVAAALRNALQQSK
jgi:hypothetical protein